MRLVRVAVPVPVLGSLSYAVPPTLSAPSVGARVLVPLGKRVLTGIVVDADGSSAAESPGMRPAAR